MTIHPHYTGEIKIAEVLEDGVIVHDAEDALDLMGNLYYQGFDSMILHQKNITEAFFDLKNKMAGEILQKFSNYRMRLVIVGEFAHLPSQSLQDFIFESNKGKQVNFLGTVDDAVQALSI